MGVPRMSRLFFSALALLAASHLKPTPNLNPAVTINVDAAANRGGIDDRIYGVAFSDAVTIDDLSLPLNRWGGNTTRDSSNNVEIVRFTPGGFSYPMRVIVRGTSISAQAVPNSGGPSQDFSLYLNNARLTP
jgi:hypothetical protein